MSGEEFLLSVLTLTSTKEITTHELLESQAARNGPKLRVDFAGKTDKIRQAFFNREALGPMTNLSAGRGKERKKRGERNLSVRPG